MAPRSRYSIEELADLGGVSRRTVRYYVQEGLIPTPTGVGRGRHYDQTHLDRLLEVKALQASGRSLDEIRAPKTSGAHRDRSRIAVALPRQSFWRRVVLAPGVELQIATGVPLEPVVLQELADWCSTRFEGRVEQEDHHDDKDR